MLYSNDINEVLSIMIMLILYTLIYIFIVSKIKVSRRMNIIIIISIIIRILFTIIDTYFIFLPNSGADSVVFENHAYKILNGSFSIKSYNFDFYPKVIYFIYLLIGRRPILIRTINGIMSMLTGLLIYKSIMKINGNKRISEISMLVFLLFPHSLVFSSIILRESSIVFFSTLSIYYFINITKNSRIIDLFKSFIFIIIASLFHAGIIFVAIPYLYFIIIYKSKDITIKMKKSIILIIVLLLIIFILSMPNLFLRKISFLTSKEALFNKLNGANEYGINANIGSAYLSSIRVNSIIDLLLYMPIKVFYFLFSPMPWDVRGIRDILALVFDSVFYIITVPKTLLLLRKKYERNNGYLLIKSLIYSYICITIVFAMGTLASGTAIRHRYKGLSLIIIILSNSNDMRKYKLKK